MEGSSGSWAAWARKVAYDTLDSGGEASGAAGADLEHGTSEDGSASWASWANQANSALGRVRQQAAEAAGAVAQAAERAKTTEWAEQAKGWQSDVGSVLGRMAEGATQAGSVLSEKGKVATSIAKDLQGLSSAKLNEAKAIGAAKAREAREKATAAAGAAAKGLERASSGLSGGLGGLATLTMSPMKLAQFVGAFFLGVMLITMSFSFLPMLVIAPQKFALLFALGSMTLLGSFAILKTPTVFAAGLLQRDKLPFSISYLIGLIGTLYATLVMRSYVHTAVFGVLQAVALLYFMASYIPGGKAVLNLLGRSCARVVRAAACHRMK